MSNSMDVLKTVILADLREAIRGRWFFLYSIIFGGAIVLLFALGITESQVMGFTGLSRLLVTYLQLCIAILPIFILITTVRTVVGERESNVLEYFLSMPISLGNYFWGKLFAKFLVVFLPVCLAFLGAVLWGTFKGLEVPWHSTGYYALQLAGLAWCFLGIGMLISSIVRKQEWALGMAFFTWLMLLLFIDIIMIGVMLQGQIQKEVIVGVSLLNPLQTFRTGAVLLFDPELSSMGPASFVILDTLGAQGYLLFSVAYPIVLGWLFSWGGYVVFKRGDLV